MVVGFTTTYAVSAYHHRCCSYLWFKRNSKRFFTFIVIICNRNVFWKLTSKMENILCIPNTLNVCLFVLWCLTPHGGPSWSWSYGSWIYNYLCSQCLSPPMLWVRISIGARCTTLCDKVYQWLATGRWFSPGPPVSSTNKTDRHDIAEILLNVCIK
jgi:hypothetical protein